MNVWLVAVFMALFISLDILFYRLIIKSMDRPSPQALFARERGFAVIPDDEGGSLLRRLRGALPMPGGDLLDIVELPFAGAEGYLFMTLPEKRSRYPRTRENRRQFIAVLMKTPVDRCVFIHPPIRPPFMRFKSRRLFRVFKTEGFTPVADDRLLGEIAGNFRVRSERVGGDLGRLLGAGTIEVLKCAPRRRGFSLLIAPGGFVVYINPLLKSDREADMFYDFVVRLTGALKPVSMGR